MNGRGERGWHFAFPAHPTSFPAKCTHRASRRDARDSPHPPGPVEEPPARKLHSTGTGPRQRAWEYRPRWSGHPAQGSLLSAMERRPCWSAFQAKGVCGDRGARETWPLPPWAVAPKQVRFYLTAAQAGRTLSSPEPRPRPLSQPPSKRPSGKRNSVGTPLPDHHAGGPDTDNSLWSASERTQSASEGVSGTIVVCYPQTPHWPGQPIERARGGFGVANYSSPATQRPLTGDL